MNAAASLLEKINHNKEVVGIIGLGYVGLPLAVNFAEAGIKVIGFDKNQEKVSKINRGDNYIKDIRDAVLREVVSNIKLEATTEFSRIGECDALLICVPTPLDKIQEARYELHRISVCLYRTKYEDQAHLSAWKVQLILPQPKILMLPHS